MTLRGSVVGLLAAVLGGCALITGAADLQIGPDSTPEAGSWESGTDTGLGSSADGAVDGPSPVGDAAKDALVDGALDGPASTRIRAVTFENGLTGVAGADTTSGTVNLEVAAPIDGTSSMTCAPAGGYANVTLPPTDELFATVLVRISNLGSSPTVFARFQLQGTLSTLDLVLTVGTTFQVKFGATVLGSGGNFNQEGATHRFGIHLKRTGASGLIEVYEGARGVAFGASAVNTTVSGSVGPVIGVQIGAIAGTSGAGVALSFDDLLVDTASMPPP